MRVTEKSLKRFKMRIRELTRRTRGRNITKIIEELRRYFAWLEGLLRPQPVSFYIQELDSWIRRKLRCDHWKKWGPVVTENSGAEV